jgi:arabinose-5-phosphate isomerase
MSTEAGFCALAPPDLDALEYGREVMRREATAVLQVAARLDGRFRAAVELLYTCRGSAIVTGMGKAGIIGQKVAATLASTGTRSHYLHPAEAVHGDLGRIGPDDVILAFSKSGETEELVRILPSLRELGTLVVAVTSRATSPLARAATVTLELGPLEEACPLGLAPSTSTTVMLALGDALALAVSRMRGFRREDFNVRHPAGALGRLLSAVEDHMRPRDDCRIAPNDQTVRQAITGLSRPGRRSGAILVVDGEGRLCGLFTDSDLARLLEGRRDEALDRPIAEVMTRQPRTVAAGARMSDAVELLARHKISELPVVDGQGQPAGLIDVTDLVSWIPEEAPTAAETPVLRGRSAVPPPKLSLFHQTPAKATHDEGP